MSFLRLSLPLLALAASARGADAQLSCDYSGVVPAAFQHGPVPANPLAALTPTTPLQPGERFGTALDIEGNRAVVTAGDPAISSTRRAYVFEFDGTQWHETAVLSTPGEAYESSVALSGNRIVVGAFDAVYVFQLDVPSGVWVQTQTITCPASPGTCGGSFGGKIALEGDYLAVGDPDALHPTLGVYTGGVHVYEGSVTGWFTKVASLFPGRGVTGDSFGGNLAFEGTRLVVSANLTNLTGFGNAGSIYVYKRQTTNPLAPNWNLEQRINAPQPQLGGQFGYDVAISGTVLVATAAYESALGQAGAGAAYVFTRSGTTWSLVRRLSASDAHASAHFGWSVDLDGLRLVVGAPCDTITGGATGNPCPAGLGAVYVFEATSSAATVWSEVNRFLLPAPLAGDRLGTSLALSGTTALSGAIEDDARTGTTWILDLPATHEIQATDYLLSLQSGGTVTLELDAGVEHAGELYYVLGSEKADLEGGTVFLTETCTLPLVSEGPVTPYSVLTLTNPTDSHLGSFLGTLDANGRATATLSIAPGENPSFLSAGTTLYHLFFTYEEPFTPTFTSHMATVTIVP